MFRGRKETSSAAAAKVGASAGALGSSGIVSRDIGRPLGLVMLLVDWLCVEATLAARGALLDAAEAALLPGAVVDGGFGFVAAAVFNRVVVAEERLDVVLAIGDGLAAFRPAEAAVGVVARDNRRRSESATALTLLLVSSAALRRALVAVGARAEALTREPRVLVLVALLNRELSGGGVFTSSLPPTFVAGGFAAALPLSMLSTVR